MLPKRNVMRGGKHDDILKSVTKVAIAQMRTPTVTYDIDTQYGSFGGDTRILKYNGKTYKQTNGFSVNVKFVLSREGFFVNRWTITDLLASGHFIDITPINVVSDDSDDSESSVDREHRDFIAMIRSNFNPTRVKPSKKPKEKKEQSDFDPVQQKLVKYMESSREASEMKKEKACVVCFTMIPNVAIGQCGHIFCPACIFNCYERNKECATCRGLIEDVMVIKKDLYL